MIAVMSVLALYMFHTPALKEKCLKKLKFGLFRRFQAINFALFVKNPTFSLF
jgi:hypothetical protein